MKCDHDENFKFEWGGNVVVGTMICAVTRDDKKNILGDVEKNIVHCVRWCICRCHSKKSGNSP